MDVVNELVTGALFAGRYRIVRRVAAGGMGAVYEVIHVETDRRRALKIMHPHMFQSDELRQRFQREAKIAAHIESEFIVVVVLVIAVLVRLAPTDPESTEPPAAMSAGSSIASAPAPVVAIAKPETPSSGMGNLAGKPLPSATASPVSSSEPARKKTLTTPVLKQRKHTWE